MRLKDWVSIDKNLVLMYLRHVFFFQDKQIRLLLYVRDNRKKSNNGFIAKIFKGL